MMEEAKQQAEEVYEESGSEPGANGASQEDVDVGADDRQMADELFNELGHLAGQFVEIVRVAWNSDERKQIEADLKNGLSGLATGLEDGFRKVSENEQTQDVLDKAENVAESVGDKLRDSKAANDLAGSLLAGLRALGQQLEQWTEEVSHTREGTEGTPGAEASGPDVDSQDIPIEKM